MRKSRIVNAPTDTPTPADSAPTPPEPAASPPGPGRAGDVWGAVASMLVALPSAIAYGVLVFTAVSPSTPEWAPWPAPSARRPSG